LDTKQLANISHPVIVAPKLNPDPFVYVVRDGKDEYSLRLWQADGKEKLLEQGLDVKQVNHHRLVEWSPSGKYILVGGNRIYRASDGRIAQRLNGTAGTWSPERDRLLYVAQNRSAPGRETPLPAEVLGQQVWLFDLDTNKRQRVYQAPGEEWVFQGLTWDPEGRFFAFPTGKRIDRKWVVQEVHVMDGKMFHYVENEQNELPTELKHLLLSEDGRYVSYAANGILKLINLRTQESRVYDVTMQVQRDQSEFVRYDPRGVWLGQTHRILHVSDTMEEEEIYRSQHPLAGFYLSSRRDRMLVMEEGSQGTQLRLIDLLSHRKEEAAGFLHLRSS
jgi:hypothetical protein